MPRRTGPKTLAIQLEGSWDAYLRSRHHGLRKKLRSRPRQLQQLGEVTYEHADPSNALAAVDDMIHLHDVRWAGRQDATVISRSASGRAFYRTVLPWLVEEGIADLVTMRLDGRAIASQAGFQSLVVNLAEHYFELRSYNERIRLSPQPKTAAAR